MRRFIEEAEPNPAERVLKLNERWQAFCSCYYPDPDDTVTTGNCDWMGHRKRTYGEAETEAKNHRDFMLSNYGEAHGVEPQIVTITPRPKRA